VVLCRRLEAGQACVSLGDLEDLEAGLGIELVARIGEDEIVDVVGENADLGAQFLGLHAQREVGIDRGLVLERRSAALESDRSLVNPVREQIEGRRGAEWLSHPPAGSMWVRCSSACPVQ
jgi:hypothetical protein